MSAPTSFAPPRLELRGISKRYPGCLANDRIDLCIDAGEIHALLGENGAGKSTLMKIIYGVTRPDAGEIRWQGEPVQVRDPARARALGIGMVFQHFELFPHLSITENLTIAQIKVLGRSKEEATKKGLALLERVGLKEHAHKHPGQLSGGQQQRVAIARALAMDPVVMLFDEPTSALDPELVGEVLKVLEQLAAEGMTLILVTHEMNFAREVGDRVVFMHQGRVWEQGDSKTLFASPQTSELKQFISSVRGLN